MHIVTHSGQAHADDILAVALILVKEGLDFSDAHVQRVANGPASDYPTARFVVDIGGVYDPTIGRFDHHQFPPDSPPDCALTLVARYYGMTVEQYPWMKKLALLDSKGPYTWFSETFGRKAKNYREVQTALNEKESVFAYFTHIANRHYENANSFEDAVRMACNWLKLEIDYVSKKATNVEYAKSNLEIVDLGGFKMAFFRQMSMRGTSEVCDDVTEADPSIIVTGKLDDRGTGYSAMRLNDSDRVNFYPLEGTKGCIFAHKNGFCLKWENDWKGFLEAVKRGVK